MDKSPKSISTSSWSESLQEQTRDAIAKIAVGPGGKLHFKHRTNGFAYMSLGNLVEGRLLLIEKKSAQGVLFTDVDALLAGGWVID